MDGKPLARQMGDEWAALQAASHVLVSFMPLLGVISDASDTDAQWEEAELALRALSVALDKANLPPPSEFASSTLAAILRNASVTLQALEALVRVTPEMLIEGDELTNARAAIAKARGK